jgi:hypothetical protein
MGIFDANQLSQFLGGLSSGGAKHLLAREERKKQQELEDKRQRLSVLQMVLGDDNVTPEVHNSALNMMFELLPKGKETAQFKSLFDMIRSPQQAAQPQPQQAASDSKAIVDLLTQNAAVPVEKMDAPMRSFLTTPTTTGGGPAAAYPVADALDASNTPLVARYGAVGLPAVPTRAPSFSVPATATPSKPARPLTIKEIRELPHVRTAKLAELHSLVNLMPKNEYRRGLNARADELADEFGVKPAPSGGGVAPLNAQALQSVGGRLLYTTMNYETRKPEVQVLYEAPPQGLTPAQTLGLKIDFARENRARADRKQPAIKWADFLHSIDASLPAAIPPESLPMPAGASPQQPTTDADFDSFLASLKPKERRIYTSRRKTMAAQYLTSGKAKTPEEASAKAAEAILTVKGAKSAGPDDWISEPGARPAWGSGHRGSYRRSYGGASAGGRDEKDAYFAVNSVNSLSRQIQEKRSQGFDDEADRLQHDLDQILKRARTMPRVKLNGDGSADLITDAPKATRSKLRLTF